MAIILVSYRLDVLEPPPLLRDTSASGGHGMETFAITTQPPWGERALKNPFAISPLPPGGRGLE